MVPTTRARLVLTALLALAIPAAAAAVNFPVTKTADTADGTCDADCSLREAIIAANALAGPDIVTVPAGTYLLTIPGATGEDAAATGDLDIGSGGLTINGAGAATTIVDGGGTIRVFEVVGTGTVAVTGLTIRNGLGGFGAGIENDNNGASLTIDQSQILNNTATSFGGGVNNNGGGTITITNSVISGNTATFFGGGVNNNIGGTVNIDATTISMNTANGFGGGGLNNNSGGPMMVSASVIANNSAPNGSGGGINNNSSGTMTLTDVTVSGNTASGSICGGGILNNSNGPLTIVESTISGNSATAGPGGGICYNSGGTFTITNSTISGNSTTDTGGGGGLYMGSSSVVTLTNVTMIGNSAPGTSGGALRKNALSATLSVLRSIVANSTSGGNCSGTITSLGNNISSDATCNFVAAGDLPPGTNPLVEPLAANGGPTETHALQGGSPAINAGGAGCPPPATDQRGINRPQGAACEIGSFECQAGECAGVGPTPTLTPTGVAPTATPTPTVPAPTATATPTVSTGAPVNVPTLSWPLLLVLAVTLASAGYLLSRRA